MNHSILRFNKKARERKLAGFLDRMALIAVA